MKCLSISFGLGGHGEEYENGMHVSGYQSPETWKPKEEPESIYPREFPDGTPVFDTREVMAENPGLAISNPMHKPSLPPGTVERFDRSCSLVNLIAESQTGEFGTLARLALNTRFSGLDYVATDVFTAIMRSQGARVGHLEGGKIVWDDPWFGEEDRDD